MDVVREQLRDVDRRLRREHGARDRDGRDDEQEALQTLRKELQELLSMMQEQQEQEQEQRPQAQSQSSEQPVVADIDSFNEARPLKRLRTAGSTSNSINQDSQQLLQQEQLQEQQEKQEQASHLFSSSSSLFDASVRVEAESVPAPSPVRRWQEMPVHPSLFLGLPAGCSRPTSVQQYAVPVLMERRDLLCSAQTGSGKTLAFALPITELVRRELLAESLVSAAASQNTAKKSTSLLSYHAAFPRAVVLAPTRELAAQIYEVFRSLAVALRNPQEKQESMIVPRVVLVCGGRNEREQADLISFGGCDILIATPGRLIDFLRRDKLRLRKCGIFCLDEADRMLDMGFEQELRAITTEFDLPPANAAGPDANSNSSSNGSIAGQQWAGKGDNAVRLSSNFADGVTGDANTRTRITALFSATFPRPIRRLAADMMRRERVGMVVGTMNAAVDTVRHRVWFVDAPTKVDRLREILTHSSTIERGAKVVVFVATRKTADFVGQLCQRWGLASATVIHGSMTQAAREVSLGAFRRPVVPGQPAILVATDVAARGIDVDDAMAVVNYDLPKQIDEYIHRVGRTGRAGRRGTATSFFCWQYDRKLAPVLAKFLREHGQEVPSFLERVPAATNTADIETADDDSYYGEDPTTVTVGETAAMGQAPVTKTDRFATQQAAGPSLKFQ